MSITHAPMPWAVFAHQNFQQNGGSNNIINQYTTFHEALTLAKQLYKYIHESTHNVNERSLWIEHTHTPKSHQSIHHVIPLGAMITWQHFGDFHEYRTKNQHHLTSIFSESLNDITAEYEYNIHHGNDYIHQIRLVSEYTRTINTNECISHHQRTQYTLHTHHNDKTQVSQKTSRNTQEIFSDIHQELHQHILSFPNLSNHERIQAIHTLTHALSNTELQHPVIEPTIIIR